MPLSPSAIPPYSQRPVRSQGLYDPAYEHDGCGVGMICDISGNPSHSIIGDALQMIVNLTHRGAAGCDDSTGDGAGIMMQMPHRFMRKAAGDAGIVLPPENEYGSGLVFLPRSSSQQEFCRREIEAAVQAQGQQCLGWRTVPFNPVPIGDLARHAQPAIEQIFIGRGEGLADSQAFERKLYTIRKIIEGAVRNSELTEKQFFHIPSLSHRTFVYKGMFLSAQMAPFFPDLSDPDMLSALALVHQRYSTNTFPSWDLAQPFRFLCHNGEINTLRGNVNWMQAREHQFQSDLFGADMAKLLPIATPGASDSAVLDNAVELLYHSGRSLPHCMSMLIPEAWQNHQTMSDAKKAFYEYHACLMEPWDGPATIPFSDGQYVGAILDRNGLRPSRYTVTNDGRLILASETGVLDVAPADVRYKGRLQPGKMLLIDLAQQRIIDDDEVKAQMAARHPYGQWLGANLIHLKHENEPIVKGLPEASRLLTAQRLFGYTAEDFSIVLAPMARSAGEAIGSMGDDIPPAVLSKQPRLLYDYFKQLFAQVTNPPLDAIREELVTSLRTTMGAEQNLFEETPEHCRQLILDYPILTAIDLDRIRAFSVKGFANRTLSIIYSVNKGGSGLGKALTSLCTRAAKAVRNGKTLLILSDRKVDSAKAPIPALLATAAVHHHLIGQGLRSRCGLIVETGEAREVHHFACLLGYGAGAVAPYLAYDCVRQMAADGQFKDAGADEAIDRYIKAINKGLLKIMSKMGISTLQSYRGAQMFECVGLHTSLVNRYFSGTASRINGADVDTLATEILHRHQKAYPQRPLPYAETLDSGGKYKWRRNAESHQYNPLIIGRLQQAVRTADRDAWQDYCEQVNLQNRSQGLLRGLFEFNPVSNPAALDEVEPWQKIVRRFKTGAMSYGSISKEAHETQAIAMNRLGAKSNSGEGGEDADRFDPGPNGDWRNSAIKQVASGRFGVTINYLSHAREIQIKMAQGAKPGEGGQLPGEKVYPWIAKTRHATPYVGLISPPPHHDIYSIEDLAQLIFDLKNANRQARISVKLVSEVGVGTVAAGVVKAGADVVLISGGEGGTGAAPQTSIRYGGLPWELGLAETNQTLLLNGLRDRIVVECDGQLKTARDVAIACLLGAEEFGFGTISLVALGCIMMRVCHLNTCPVGIATQDPDLRKKFAGKPEHLVNFMRFVAQDLRKIMAQLGFRRIDEMIGQVERLTTREAVDHWKAQGLDFSNILAQPEISESIGRYCTHTPDLDLEEALDLKLLHKIKPAIETATPVKLDVVLTNSDRTFGTIISNEIAKRHGDQGLPDDTITILARGSAGQSLGAFGARGLRIDVQGDANDYFGKGLSGARLAIRPPKASTFAPEDNVIIGNVALYGATSGEAYINGLAGERFCVRNSGATAVVEGGGDHGCEYMTGGKVLILGPTGRNFAAGMTGGIAYVLAPGNEFARYRCNLGTVALEAEIGFDEMLDIKRLIEMHFKQTQSPLASRILKDWTKSQGQIVKVMPVEYKQALERLAKEAAV